MKKLCVGKLFFGGALLFLLCASCVSYQENRYLELTFDDAVQRKGNPLYTINQIIETGYSVSDYEPDFDQYFTQDELAESVVVKYAVWKRTHSTLMIWYKQEAEDNWIAFYSQEYTQPFIR